MPLDLDLMEKGRGSGDRGASSAVTLSRPRQEVASPWDTPSYSALQPLQQSSGDRTHGLTEQVCSKVSLMQTNTVWDTYSLQKGNGVKMCTKNIPENVVPLL